MNDLAIIAGLPFVAIALRSFVCWCATEFGIALTLLALCAVNVAAIVLY